MIPQIIHQIWYQGENNIPSSYPNYSKSWKKLNPNYKYMFWDKDKIENLITSHYPYLIQQYTSYDKIIQKIDMAKYIILHYYGGIYVDLDSEALKPIDNLINNKKIVLVKIDLNALEKYFAYKQFTGPVLQNNVIATVPKHPFWLHVLELLQKEDIRQGRLESDTRYIFRTTGPTLLTKSYETFPNKQDITLIDSNLIDPFSWCDYDGYNCGNGGCREIFNNVFALHHYGSKNDTNSWIGSTEKNLGKLYCRYKYPLYGSVLLIFILTIYLVYYYIYKNK